MQETSQTDGGQDNQDQGGSPLDDMISKVDSYIADPKLVTVDTLKSLKTDLEDLKSVMDQEEGGEGEPPQDGANVPGGGVAVMIGNMKKGMK